MRILLSRLRSFRRDTRGAALVEFAICLPLMLVLFAATVESMRMFWSYQTTIWAVRDGARYVARAAVPAACSGSFPSSVTSTLQTLVEAGIYPSGDVTHSPPSATCKTGVADPVAQVAVTLTIQFPFGQLFALAGGALPALTTTVTGESRIFGE